MTFTPQPDDLFAIAPGADGLDVEESKPRRRRRRRTSARGRAGSVALAAALTLLLASIAIAAASGADDAGAQQQLTWVAREPSTADRTPRFAACGAIQLHLPVAERSLTALAFHQASGSNTLPMVALVADADMDVANDIHGVPPCETVDTEDDVLDAPCLRLWRSNRGGEPDTAADIGADPGTPVLAPVTGVIVSAEPYELYGKYDDVRIAIRPDGRDDIDVVLIHITDPLVGAGDRVEAGVTRLASVRKMSDKMELQLGQYAANGGDHVHLQINRAETAAEEAGS